MDQQEQVSLGLLGVLDFRQIQQISKYLHPSDVLNFGLTNSFFRDALLGEAQVRDNQIQLYLELDISEIYDKIEAIMAIVETKDQGWASANYSTSWVSLSLFNNEDDYKQHENTPFETIIYENYREKQYQERKLKITETIKEDPKTKHKHETIIGQCRKGLFKKLGIVQKCQYPGWECYLRSAKILVWFRD